MYAKIINKFEARKDFMGKIYSRLALKERLYICEQLVQKTPVIQIAQNIKHNISTVYREIRRGTVKGKYDPYLADEKVKAINRCKGAKGIISKEVAEIISQLILNEALSPEKVIIRLREMNLNFEVPTSTRTIYSAIDKGIIPNVSRSDLHKNKTTTHVFSNGMIRIPKWIIEKTNIKDGDIASFEFVNNEIIIKIKK